MSTVQPLEPGSRHDLRVGISPDAVLVEGDVNEVGRPTGNSETYPHRRRRKFRPDIHKRVLDGELTAYAGMIEAERRADT
jgi:hypothetical protein